MKTFTIHATIEALSAWDGKEKTIRQKFEKWLKSQGFLVKSSDVVQSSEKKLRDT